MLGSQGNSLGRYAELRGTELKRLEGELGGKKENKENSPDGREMKALGRGIRKVWAVERVRGWTVINFCGDG